MPITTLLWVLMFAGAALSAFINPAMGAFLYLLEYYRRPALFWWGQWLPPFRYNLIASTVLIVAYLVRRSSMRDIGPYKRGPAACLVGLALLMVVVTPMFGANQTRSWEQTSDYTKLILFHSLVVATVRSEAAFDLLVAAHIAGAGWWGWDVYLDPEREHSRLVFAGSGDTQGDNFLAIHLLTVIPLAVVYLLMHPDKRLKLLALLASPFVLNMFILCNSRGATVGMIAMGAMALILAKRGHRLRMVGAGLLFVAALYRLADPEFIERQQSTANYEADGSANQRLASWSGGLRLLANYPLGAGGGGYNELSPIYIPEVVAANDGELRAPHNTFVLVASEWGIPGLILFLGYYASLFRLLREVRQRAPEGGLWYYRSIAIQLGLVGVLVAGTFADRLYGEAPYWMGAFAVALHRLQSHKLALAGTVPAPAQPTPTAPFDAQRVRPLGGDARIVARGIAEPGGR